MFTETTHVSTVLRKFTAREIKAQAENRAGNGNIGSRLISIAAQLFDVTVKVAAHLIQTIAAKLLSHRFG